MNVIGMEWWRQCFHLWTFMKNHPWSLKRKITSSSMEAISLTPHWIHARIRNLLNHFVTLTLPHKIFNPLILPVHKDFERVVVDAYVYHNIANLVGINLEIGTQRLILEGKPLQELETILRFCRRTDQFIRVQVQWQPASGRTVILEPI